MGTMVEGSRRRAAKAWAIAASALFFSLAAAPLPAQGPPPAMILDGIRDNGLDPDSDGLYEYLVLRVPLMVERADVYSVGAQGFVQNSTAPLSRAGQTLFLDAGEQAVKLTFPGSAFVSLQPRQLLMFKISVSDSAGRPVDGRTFVGTNGYSGSMFDGAPGSSTAEFTGRVAEVPEEVHPGGRFGYLNITFEVRNLTGEAQVSGTLNRQVRGTGILRTQHAAGGTALAELRFDGGSIRDLGAAGPYNVTVRLLALESGHEISRDYLTAPYNATDFEQPPAPVAFTGNTTDAGLDTDGNGLFELLSVNVEVAVALEGAYMFRATLRLPEPYRAAQDLVTPQLAYLDFPGNRTYFVHFNFSGPILRTLQLDGPYTIVLDAFSERVLYITNGTCSTRAYLASQFDKPRLPARFSGEASMETVDKDKNGLFDFLTVAVPVEVDLAGIYQLAGALSAGDRFITWARGQLYLPPGKGKVSLRFDGEAIRQAGFDGPYTVVLLLGAQVTGRPGIGAYLPPDRLEVRTTAYKAADFEKRVLTKKPLPLPEDLDMKLGEGSLKGRARTITAEVNRSAPDINFYYTLDDGRSALFRLVFTKLVAYQDVNSNGVYDTGEERYEGLLSLAGWEASKVDFTGEEGGRTLRYNLTAVLDLSAVGFQAGLGSPQGRIPQWGCLTFSFTMTSRDLNFTSPTAFSLRGGTEMKIDILIEPGRDLPGDVSGLSLQHYLSDESGSNYFRTFESDQTRVFKPGASVENGTIFRSGLSALQKIGLASSGGKEHGYYTWLRQVLVENQDGSSGYMPVNLTYSTDGRQMALALNYPLPEGTVSLLHDPTVGVNATNAPAQEPGIIKILFNPWLYIVAAGIAVAVVAIIRRSQRNGE